MSTEEQLGWEARWARPAALAAFATVALLIAGTVVRQAVALSDRPEDEAEFLRAIDESSGAFIASSIVQALSFVTLVGVLLYLGRATIARRPESPGILIWLGVLGPPLLAVASVVSDFARLDAADRFLASGQQTVDRAETLLEDTGVAAAAIGSAGTLALAIAFVFISINAMRVGLLTRFMGIVGAIIGALYVIPLLAGPLVVQIFWLLALGALFLGHWPGGRGPAWETGEAAEWPSGVTRQQPDDQQLEPAPNDHSDEPSEEPTAPRPRKRKRR